MSRYKCPYCNQWIGSMQLHEPDVCQESQDRGVPYGAPPPLPANAPSAPDLGADDPTPRSARRHGPQLREDAPQSISGEPALPAGGSPGPGRPRGV